MLRFLLYEWKKTILNKFHLLLLLSFGAMTCIMIIYQWYNGDTDYQRYAQQPENAHVNQYINQLHAEFDGELTEQKIVQIIALHEALSDSAQLTEYKGSYGDPASSGYPATDLWVFQSTIYEPTRYMAQYAGTMDTYLAKARKNIEIYEARGIPAELSKNIYILDHYDGRKLTTLYDTSQWELLYAYHGSDILILVLLLCAVSPLYATEEETRMQLLIGTGRYGRQNLALAKPLSIFLYTAVTVVFFSLLNLITFYLLYGLSGADMPLYALPGYQFTPLSCSVLTFYLLLSAVRLTGFLALSALLCLVSRITRRVLTSYICGIALIIILTYQRGFYEVRQLSLLALCSPLSLLTAEELWKSPQGYDLAGRYIHSTTVNGLIQGGVLLIAIALLILSFYKRRKHYDKI